MSRTKQVQGILNGAILFLLLIVTICGLGSFNTDRSYEILNQYGQNIRIWGAGVYAHDSYFKAPIFIGSDFTILICVVPWMIVTFGGKRKIPTAEYDIRMFGFLSLLLYYSASQCFGVTYNALHLVYILLFGILFFTTGTAFLKLHTVSVQKPILCSFHFTGGMQIFLLVAGVSLIVAWLPDIVTSLAKGTSLELIEVYTTETTYVLDMGIISPLTFLTCYLAKRGHFIGYALLRMIFRICMVVGIMLPVQTFFQLAAGISIPIPAFITKVFIFIFLAVFAAFFDYRLKRGTKYTEEQD